MNIDFEVYFKIKHMSVKLTFWVRPSQKNTQNRVPIYLRIQQDSKRSQHSIGEFINITQWDKKAQKVKGNSVEAQAMNSKLDTLKARALKICNELLLLENTRIVTH